MRSINQSLSSLKLPAVLSLNEQLGANDIKITALNKRQSKLLRKRKRVLNLSAKNAGETKAEIMEQLHQKSIKPSLENCGKDSGTIQIDRAIEEKKEALRNYLD